MPACAVVCARQLRGMTVAVSCLEGMDGRSARCKVVGKKREGIGRTQGPVERYLTRDLGRNVHGRNAGRSGVVEAVRGRRSEKCENDFIPIQEWMRGLAEDRVMGPGSIRQNKSDGRRADLVWAISRKNRVGDPFVGVVETIVGMSCLRMDMDQGNGDEPRREPGQNACVAPERFRVAVPHALDPEKLTWDRLLDGGKTVNRAPSAGTSRVRMFPSRVPCRRSTRIPANGPT